MRLLSSRLTGVAWRAPVLAGIGIFLLVAGAGAQPVSVRDLHPHSEYESAAAPRVFQLACSSEYDALFAYFTGRRIPFDAEAVRRVGGQSCHILYEPTVPGFRAHPVSAEVRGLYLSLPQMRILAAPGTAIGDGLDIAKSVLAQTPAALHVNLNSAVSVPRPQFDSAVGRHFPNTRHHIAVVENPEVDVISWSQDYIKSGVRRGETHLLVPYRVFEGVKANGAKFKPLLDALAAPDTTRSRLSWEGGDLLFVRHPLHPDRLVMFYGDAARPYWGGDLTNEEYAYVLRREFGADESIYFGGIAPHVDYTVSFLPGEQIAIVAQPVANNLEIARAAVRMLSLTFSNPVPPLLVQFEAALARPDSLAGNEKRIRELIKAARTESANWSLPVDGEAYERIQEHIEQHCATDVRACTDSRQLGAMAAKQASLFAIWVEMAATLRAAELLPGAMLSVIEDQLPGETKNRERVLLGKVEKLTKMGFRVIRAPWIGGEMSGQQAWAGISPVNLLRLDRRVFLPVFGLGPEEQRLVELFARQLPAHYEVRPVFARAALLQSGGVHCLMGIVREDEITD